MEIFLIRFTEFWHHTCFNVKSATVDFKNKDNEYIQ